MNSSLACKGLEDDIRNNDDWTFVCARLWLDVYECLTDDFNFKHKVCNPKKTGMGF